MLLTTVSKSGRCFQNGAFVINVSGVEHEAMALVMHSGGRKRALQKTHDVFMRQGAWNAHRRDPTNGATIRALTPQLDFSLDDGFHACGARKRVALAYLFRITSASSEEKTFMYLKLETHPTRSLGHTRDAFQRYVLKKPQRGSLSMPTRRENSFKNKNHDTDPEMLHADARAWGAAADEYDSKYRTGREMYIPSSVAALLFK